MVRRKSASQPDGLWETVHFDCLHYRGDRPCLAHKRSGCHCAGCGEYHPVTRRVLMIKLDAMGDVLRTTCLLDGLSKKYRKPQLTWITGRPSLPLLANNPFVHRVIAYGEEALATLAAESFDVVINLDSAPRSATLATLARSDRKIGYVLDERGIVRPTGPKSVRWHLMGLFDDLKKSNTRTFQELMCEILDLDPASCRYVLELTDEERQFSIEWARTAGLVLEDPSLPPGPIIGLNTGAGGRWKHKRWRSDGYRELASRLVRQLGAQVILLGGEEEASENLRLAESSPPGVMVSGVHPVRHFAAIVSLCDLVVAGDTLGLHLALALGCRVVALFGPTSAAEIELFGLGEKLCPELDCLVCYRERCDRTPSCMDLIETSHVLAAIWRVLQGGRGSGAATRAAAKSPQKAPLPEIGAEAHGLDS